MKKISISRFPISDDSPVMIVAEIGLNHNGDLKLAEEMIVQAAAAGADAVKFQLYRTADFIHPRYAKAQYDILKKFELSPDQYLHLKQTAKKNKVILFASPFDYASLDFLTGQKTPVIKIASGELSNIPFLQYAARKKVPLFISTGLHDFNEIRDSIRQIEKINDQIVLFYCLAEYPLDYSHANLKAIRQYQRTFPYPLGFSDHSPGWLLSVLAVAMGVKVIEKHFTIDRTLPGPDQKLSLDKNEFRELACHIRETEKCLGREEKVLTVFEKKIRAHALKGCYAAVDIHKGEKFSSRNVRFLRPRLKSAPSVIINSKARRNYNKDEAI